MPSNPTPGHISGESHISKDTWDFPGASVVNQTPPSSAVDVVLIHGRKLRSHMLQTTKPAPLLSNKKIPHAATRTRHSQISIFKKERERKDTCIPMFTAALFMRQYVQTILASVYRCCSVTRLCPTLCNATD